MDLIDWSAGKWTTPPIATRNDGPDLLVEAAEGSDAWRVTSYGFVHDTEHALLAPLAQGRAVEVTFVAAFEAQFDQAGLFLRAAEDVWLKAGVEWADGTPQVGAVLTNPVSDWSVAPVPSWLGRAVTVRASRDGDAVTVRARVDDDPWRLVRVAPFPPEADVAAGPYCCAPTRAGLTVRFTRWAMGPADASLHG
ncbi:MAG: DUF1349 domain-containing protein [Propionibacteriaceae bacterium]|nr:DUF1349 domain-containing protein [Propionibacteriaceae bacterium]